jgi:[acyl-carrier-protein] S-malonyltransferase
MRALIFPGQGKSVMVGMGQSIAENFAEAKEVFDEVDESLGQNLFRLMRDGPQEELTRTENAQPALMAVGVALLRVLQKQGNINLKDFCNYFAGHSLGEYTALIAAESLMLKDAAVALRHRGQAMQRAVKEGEGAMAALLGATIDVARELCDDVKSLGVCEPSNDNAIGQVVISGSKIAVTAAADRAKVKGIKRAIMLPVSAPFHCSLMQPAADFMSDILGDIKFNKPLHPIVSNVTAEAEDDPAVIRELLIRGITSTVRWREDIDFMTEHGVNSYVEFGPGKVLEGLVKKIAPDSTVYSLHEPQDIDLFLAAV